MSELEDKIKLAAASGTLDMAKFPAHLHDYIKSVAESATEEDLPTVQEMPEGFKADRFLIKNLGDDAMQSIAYLKNKYGDAYDFDSKEGQIRIKKPGEKQWKVLDPSSFDLQDISDIAYDTVAGIGQGAATATAGVAGGALGGIGAIPAAMGTSAATGAAGEALRQWLGKQAGVNEMSGKDIAISGAIGAAAPALFGTGASKGMVKAAIGGDDVVRNISSKLGNYIGKDDFAMTPANLKAAEEYLTRAQSGALNRPIEKIGGFFSGIPEKVIGKMNTTVSPYVKDFMEQAGYRFNPEDVITTTKAGEVLDFDPDKFASKFVDTIVDETKAKREQLGEQIAQGLDASGKTFNFGNYLGDLDEFLTKIKTSKNLTKADEATLEKAKKLAYNYLTTDVRVTDPATGRMFRQVDKTGKPVRKIINDASATEAMRIKNSMKDFLDFASTGGDKSSPINKELMRKFGGIHKKVSDDLYDAIDGQDLRAAYRENEEIGEFLGRKLKSEENALKTLKNMDKKTFSIVNSRLKRFDDLHGTQLSELGDVVQNWNYFSRPATVSVEGRGSEVNRRAITLGGTLGSIIGGTVAGPTGIGIGAAVGGSAGQLLTSPAAMKRMSAMGAVPGRVAGAVAEKASPVTQKMLNVISKKAPAVEYAGRVFNRAVVPAIKGGAAPSAWMLMQNRGEK